MYRLLRRLLFLFDAETIHHRVMALLTLTLWAWPLRRALSAWTSPARPALEQTLWGLTFPNPVGLAAGFDKNATSFNALGALGFGFIEIGTVTALPQPGNERPRLLRLPGDLALLNRMGFNNDGCDRVAMRLERGPIEPLLGVNLGKSKVAPLEEAAQDYARSMTTLYPYARYLVVNVSSPNTPGLRQLQEREPLLALLKHLKALNVSLAQARHETTRPLLLKISPDLSDEQLEDLIVVAREVGIDGIIATNTTLRRDLTSPGVEALGAGGVSGRPVHARALQVVRTIYQRTQGQLPIIGVGGVFDAEDAVAMIEAGASLVQVWTGFVYRGPGLPRRLNRGLERALKARGLTRIEQLVGLSHRRAAA